MKNSMIKTLTLALVLGAWSVTANAKTSFCDGLDRANFELTIRDQHTIMMDDHLEETGIASNQMTFLLDTKIPTTELENFLGKGIIPSSEYIWNYKFIWNQGGVSYRVITEMDYPGYYEKNQGTPVSFSYVYKKNEALPVASIETAGEDYDLTLCEDLRD